jgi:hypothetical protein
MNSTDEIDHITPEERKALVGQCDSCGEWMKFNRGEEKLHSCGGKVLSQTVHTQRTFDTNRAKKATAKFKVKK